jgi:hypothetical protein
MSLGCLRHHQRDGSRSYLSFLYKRTPALRTVTRTTTLACCALARGCSAKNHGTKLPIWEWGTAAARAP